MQENCNENLTGIRVYVNKFLSTRLFQTAIGKGIIISGFVESNRLALVKLTICQNTTDITCTNANHNSASAKR
jgi:hypothetical protein